LNYKLSSQTAQLRSEAFQAAMKRKNAKLSVDPDYRLDPLSENEIGWLAVLDIDVTDAECTSYLEEFLENRTRGTAESEPEQENESSLLGKLKKILKDTYWSKKIPEPRDEAEKKNIIQNTIYKAGIDIVDEGEFDSLLILPASRQIIGKF
jgi:hypothetical protein